MDCYQGEANAWMLRGVPFDEDVNNNNGNNNNNNNNNNDNSNKIDWLPIAL